MKKYCVAILILLFPSLLQGQIITTIAGGGSSGLGDGGPATMAQVNLPYGGAFDAMGNYYFLQSFGNPRLRMVDAAGIIHAIAGNGIAGFSGDTGPATLAKLNPGGLAVDAVGNVYIGDYYNNRIRKVDATTHIITTIAGIGVAGFGGDGGPATAAQIMPSGICLDPSGNIYFVDGGGYRVRKINTSGIITTVAGNGTAGTLGDGGPATDAQLAMNASLCIDAAGDLYIACSYKIRKINMTTGIIFTFAGTGIGTYIGDGMPATAAQFDSYMIGMDTANDNLYIADLGNDRVHQIDAAGVFHLIAGTGVQGFSGDTGPATAAKLFNPEGVAVDACGNLYIADDANLRIRKVTFNPTPIATISISVGPNDTVCAGTPVTFTATTTGGSTASYQWYKNGSAVSGSTSSTYTYTPTGTGDSVRCIYTGVDICSFTGSPSSNTVNMVLIPLTFPVISITAPSAAVLGTVVTVNAFVAGAGSSYSIKWYNNSVLFSTTTAPITTYVKGAGTDIISAKVSSTDPTGCYDTATSSIHAITVIPNGVDEIGSASFSASLYPNPVYGMLMVSATGFVNSIIVSNLVGQVLINKDCNSKTAQIDVANLPAGVYMVRINNYFVVKFVKQ